MVAPKLMRAALTCDYSTECLQFLRSNFDIEDPDPALVLDAVNSFQERMQRLFIKGYILGKPSDAEPAAHDPPLAKTITQLVFEEVQEPKPWPGETIRMRKCVTEDLLR